MNARILRGANQVGGSLVELEHDGDRIVLDCGLPLKPVDHRDLLPDVPGLWSAGDGSLKGVFITHGHPDHYGLADLIDPTVPIYMGQQAKKVIDAAAFFTGRDPAFTCDRFLQDGVPIAAGPFRVTPFLVDHSGFDAYALLIEAGGNTVFYTGDIRFHGRKSSRMRSLAARLPSALDCLITEGTSFGRPSNDTGLISEQALETHLAKSFQQVEGAAVCIFSPQNIDRLVTIFKASKRSGRIFVFDLYGSTIAAASGKDTIPHANWDGVKVCVRKSESRQVLRTRQFHRVDDLRGNRIYREEIATDPSNYVLCGRSGSIDELAKAGCLKGATAFWCQWSGYLDRDERVKRSLENEGVNLKHAHVSGHAPTEDLVAFAEATGARETVTVHTNSPGFLADRLASHQPREDGQWWPVRTGNEDPKGTIDEQR